MLIPNGSPRLPRVIGIFEYGDARPGSNVADIVVGYDDLSVVVIVNVCNDRILGPCIRGMTGRA